ncbi:Stress-induced-phospho 1 [Paramuricea clavata]|uniref:Stress-induced-phospho 1 n=1 Tax=Paramuricea clavata TaxID=317549 RepID=A0A7D9JRI3_PARCT|nr:Stress-induced-phospho 1 [Paramuricea clavata]
MNTFLEKLGNIQSNFDNELRELLGRMERYEKREAENTKELKRLHEDVEKVNMELSKYYHKQEEKVPYIFDAPGRNQYFSGRTRELQDLQRILNLDGTGLERKVCVAVCGLRGVKLEVSPNILKFLYDVTTQHVSAAVVMMTRRKESKLVDEILNLHKDRCLSLKCLKEEEAKQFIFCRTGLTRDDNTNSVAESLVNELGGLPLALEQAGACIKALRCNLSDYLEQFQTERLTLLRREKANRVLFFESPERLAVHTTWLLNIKHIRGSQDGEHAIRLMNAYALFNPNEIEKELVNVGERPIEDKAFRDCMSSPLGCRQVVKLLNDFSLFTYVHAHSVSTHRLVQELVREDLDPEEKAKSFVDAVRLLSFAFSKCVSPKHLLGNVGMEERLKAYDLPRNHSQYYLWSKLCFHAFHLQQNMEKLLANPDPKCLGSLFVFETAKVFYECVVYLSANQKQEEAKRTLNFVYRILDWVSVEEYDTIQNSLSNNSLFSFHVIPLPKWLQIVIKKCFVPPMCPLQPLDQKPTESPDLEGDIDKLKLKGNKNFIDGLYKEAIDAYSAAIDMSRGTTVFNALLLTNRASAYIKLNQLDDALKDANEYISRFPDCWKGYARKALALKKVSAGIAAALAYYYFYLKDGRCIFSEYKPFKGSFPGLKERISICHTPNDLLAILLSQESNTQECLRVIILGSKEYILEMDMFLPVVPMKNCIIIGAKSNASITLKLEGNTLLHLSENCMLANLSFAIDEGQIIGLGGSFVHILNCNFTSNSDNLAAVVTIDEFNAERCNFTNCKAGGLLCMGPGGNMVVDDCTFSANVRFGLEVRENGILTVRNSRMYNNGLDGLAIGPRAAKCDAFDCQIYNNAREGIAAVDDSKCVTLVRNRVFENYESGIFVRNSEVDLRENKFYDNEAWGIWLDSYYRWNVSMNETFRNQLGGVRVGGKRRTGEELSPSVVELNTSHDNFGPGYVDSVYSIDDYLRFPKTSGDCKSAKYDQNVEYNNEERITGKQCRLCLSCCSACFRKFKDLKQCGNCFTAGYCNPNCQKRHWLKHKKLCMVLREKSSFLLSSLTKRNSHDEMVLKAYIHTISVDGVGPKYSPPPPRDGKRFIVKVQLDFDRTISMIGGTPYTLLIYDRSLDVLQTIQDDFIRRLVKDFGVLCERKFREKKLCLHCAFDKTGELRFFINDFADFQKW